MNLRGFFSLFGKEEFSAGNPTCWYPTVLLLLDKIKICARHSFQFLRNTESHPICNKTDFFSEFSTVFKRDSFFSEITFLISISESVFWVTLKILILQFYRPKILARNRQNRWKKEKPLPKRICRFLEERSRLKECLTIWRLHEEKCLSARNTISRLTVISYHWNSLFKMYTPEGADDLVYQTKGGEMA